jgi:uncharacterized protein YjbI with pentapeptide repeats
MTVTFNPQHEVRLDGADLQTAFLNFADLKGANLYGAQELTEEHLEGVHPSYAMSANA